MYVTISHNIMPIGTLQLTELVQREVMRESAVEDQTSVLSYFIQTAKVIVMLECLVSPQ